MTFLELAQQRYSVRSYTSQAVEQEKLDYILEAARIAPSAVNLQPWHFLVIRSEAGREKIQACYKREWISTAPLYIMVCCDHTASWKRRLDNKDHGDIDAAIAAEHICLAAAEQGLGSCWVCNFNAPLCSESFNIPAHMEPVVIIPIGYSTETSTEKAEKKRKNIDEIIQKNLSDTQMSLIEIILIAAGLSMDSLAVSVTSGALLKECRFIHMMKIASVLAIFQAGMTVTGFLAGIGFRQYIAAIDHWIAFFILLYLGGKMILEGKSENESTGRYNPLALKKLCGLGLQQVLTHWQSGFRWPA